MKVFFSVLICFFVLSYSSFAQLSNGATAPNWTMTDIDGNAHTLYDYLNNGKAVVLDFSAAYCPSCWGYHNTHALKDFYTARGLNATNYQAHVFFIELLANNSKGCLYGSSGGGTPYSPCTGSGSAGNWVAGTPYPIIDNSSQNIPYNIASYPTILMVCPNKATYSVGTQTAAQLDNSMQTLCGITPGGGSNANPLSYQYNNVTNNNCFGNKNGSITLVVNGGTPPYSYQWNNGVTGASINNLSSGSYKATITDSQNKTLITNAISISQPNEIIATPSVVKYEKCGKNGAINLNVTGGTGDFIYQWSNNSNSPNLTNLTTTSNYDVTISDALGCLLIKKSILIDGFGNQPTVNIDNNLQLNCEVKNGVLNATVTPLSNQYTYVWSSNNGNIVSQNNNSANVNAAGIYTYKVSDNLSKCSATANTTVIANLNQPTVNIDNNLQLNCEVKNGVLNATVTPPSNQYTYVWSSSNGNIVSQNNNSANVNAAGIYTYKVSDNLSKCSATANTTVIANLTKPTITFSATAEKTLHCNQKEIMISPIIGDAGNAPLYNWSSLNEGIFVGAQNAASVKINNAGIFQLEVKNNISNCKSISLTTITAAEKPTLSLSKIGDIKCFGNQTVALSSNTGTTQTPIAYLWSNNTTSSSLEKQAAGNYTLTITDAYGCTTTSALKVTQPQALSLKVNQVIKATGTSNNGSIDITIFGGTKPYRFSWKKDSSALLNDNEDLINLAAGTYELFVNDANDCVISSEKIIVQSTTTAVEDINGLISYKFYPNPTNDILNIFLQTSDNQVITARLIDIYGKTLEYKTATSTAIFQEQFDLTELPSGVYFLHLQVGKKAIIQKILKH
jgi:hypothetical protein